MHPYIHIIMLLFYNIIFKLICYDNDNTSKFNFKKYFLLNIFVIFVHRHILNFYKLNKYIIAISCYF